MAGQTTTTTQGPSPTTVTTSVTGVRVHVTVTGAPYVAGGDFIWHPRKIITPESLWKQYKVFGVIPSKWVAVAMYIAWAFMGTNGILSVIYIFALGQSSPTAKWYVGLWLPVIWFMLYCYRLFKHYQFRKVARVMNALERANG